MRPLRITMQAFGPYAQKEEIDFSSLGSRTMFVISGKTGSGKTTIFDGLSFAIYGKASGEDRSGQELRSQFADEDSLTEVSLEFSLRGKVYYIHRSPQQERKKKSGEGTTTVTAKAELYEVNEDGERVLIGANVREVDEKIKQIIGLDANQFRQILMIPQGEFRKLLTSESKDKEVILQRLFHTEIYKRIEEKLKEEATLLKKQADANKNERKALIKDIQAGEYEELQSEMNLDDPNEIRILSLLEELNRALKDKSRSLELEEKQKQQTRDHIQQKIYQAEELISKLKERDRLKQNKEELEAKKSEIDSVKKSLLLAAKAAQLEKQEEFYLKVGRQVKSTEEEAANLSIEAEQLKLKVQKAEERYQQELGKKEQREQASAEVHRLKSLRESVSVFSGLQKETEQLHQKLKLAKDHKQKAESRAVFLEKEEEKLYLQKEESDAAALKFSEQERALETVKRMLTDLDRIKKSQSELMNDEKLYVLKKTNLEQKERELEHVRETLNQLENKWRHSHAGILASLLVEGEPCAVCGSTSHPAPAAALGDMPTEDELNAKRELLSSAEKAKSVAETGYYQAKSGFEGARRLLEDRVSSIKEILHDFQLGDLPLHTADFQHQLTSLAEELEFLGKKKSQQPVITAELGKIKGEKNNIREKIKMFAGEEEAAGRDYAEASSRLLSIQESLPEELRSMSAYESALKLAASLQQKLQDELEKSQQELQKASRQESNIQALRESADKRLAELKAELEQERSRFVADMQDQGFEKYGDYRGAKKTEQQVTSLEAAIAEYEKDYNRVKELFHDLELKLKGLEKPDLDALKQAFAAINSELEQHRAESRNVIVQLQKNQQIHKKLQAMLEEQKDLDEKYKVIGHLYEVSRGQNPFRITFERFVLAAFLDDILQEANLRLTKMTSGRYQLLRKVDPTRRNIQSGLELSVFDQYTGQERHVKTLSGGESFKAALALALGLADVVQQYSGGVSLETMFIDEGFGTLDPESLDNAIEALVDIQSSGRLVGIISHVPELKERIDARLEVTATQNGSFTEFKIMN
ncbi:AAA family ATPase [Peribacillus deserti]|uniref:Nuclease SbcCD subunit C n=1 Tax=Peribacillus deserti TaxID=673318 RepID=A0A2N5M286_9BACI|nr:SMC family ATPase [Peribacillus deserti]PLT28478.1 ATP-dependent dsDNA exonuclease [Peribacillus deserti]